MVLSNIATDKNLHSKNLANFDKNKIGKFYLNNYSLYT